MMNFNDDMHLWITLVVVLLALWFLSMQISYNNSSCNCGSSCNCNRSCACGCNPKKQKSNEQFFQVSPDCPASAPFWDEGRRQCTNLPE